MQDRRGRIPEKEEYTNFDSSGGMSWCESMDNTALLMIKDLIRNRMSADPDLSRGEALRELMEENPEWFKKYVNSKTQASLDPELRASFLSKLVEFKLKENKDFSYGMAFSEVQKENPELTLLYQSDIAKRG